MQGDRDRCLAAGMDDYVSKPFEPKLFLDTVARWIGAAAALADLYEPDKPDIAPRDARVLDDKHLDGLETMLPPGRLAGLIAAYVMNAGAVSTELTALMASDDLVGLKRVAHNLISISGNLGAERLRALAQCLHGACVSGDEIECRLMVPAIQIASIEASKSLSAWSTAHFGAATAA
jgi:HPt (histidine-containing phosphotransfer) domain-containing protein